MLCMWLARWEYFMELSNRKTRECTVKLILIASRQRYSRLTWNICRMSFIPRLKNTNNRYGVEASEGIPGTVMVRSILSKCSASYGEGNGGGVGGGISWWQVRKHWCLVCDSPWLFRWTWLELLTVWWSSRQLTVLHCAEIPLLCTTTHTAKGPLGLGWRVYIALKLLNYYYYFSIATLDPGWWIPGLFVSVAQLAKCVASYIAISKVGC